ncbi:hypothetical protein LINPERPRIM_LOCUS33945 [Linum perenne]
MELRKQETAVFCTVDEASTLCDTCHHRVPQLQQAGLQACVIARAPGHLCVPILNQRDVFFWHSLVLALTTYQASHYSRKLPSLKEITHWTFLSMMVGVQNYGPWFDVQKAGVLPVVLADFHNGINNLASDDWDYQVGLEGEHLGLEEVNASYSSLWSQGNDMPVSESLIWYKVAVIRVTTEGHPLNQSISENQSLLVCNSGCRWFLHHHNLGPVQGSE